MRKNTKREVKEKTEERSELKEEGERAAMEERIKWYPVQVVAAISAKDTDRNPRVLPRPRRARPTPSRIRLTPLFLRGGLIQGREQNKNCRSVGASEASNGEPTETQGRLRNTMCAAEW